MSPLARSLLPLALAALLHGASATYPDWPSYDPERCAMKTIGDKKGYIIYDRELGPTPVKTDLVTIPEIHRLGIELAQEIVVVCSDLGPPPRITRPEKGFTPIKVEQLSFIPYFQQELTMTVYQSYRVVAPDPSLITYPV